MPRKLINVGIEGNDGTGDDIRASFIKTNDNFQELYSVFASGGQFVSSQESGTGYVKFPNGTILAWGNSITDSSGTATIIYPISITSLKNLQITPFNTGRIFTTVTSFDTTQFTVLAWDQEVNTSVSTIFFWFSVGFSE